MGLRGRKACPSNEIPQRKRQFAKIQGMASVYSTQKQLGQRIKKSVQACAFKMPCICLINSHSSYHVRGNGHPLSAHFKTPNWNNFSLRRPLETRGKFGNKACI